MCVCCVAANSSCHMWSLCVHTSHTASCLSGSHLSPRPYFLFFIQFSLSSIITLFCLLPHVLASLLPPLLFFFFLRPHPLIISFFHSCLLVAVFASFSFLLSLSLCRLFHVCMVACHFSFFHFVASFSFTQTENHNSTTETHTICRSKGKHFPPSLPPHSPSAGAELAHTHTHKTNKDTHTHTPHDCRDSLSCSGFSWNRTEHNRRDSKTDLFDTVWVDGGLWLQDADRLCLLGALRHLPHLLSDEIMNAVQSLHRPLDQTHPLCRSWTHTHTQTDR